jgi:hypothetical protein
MVRPRFTIQSAPGRFLHEAYHNLKMALTSLRVQRHREIPATISELQMTDMSMMEPIDRHVGLAT